MQIGMGKYLTLCKRDPRIGLDQLKSGKEHLAMVVLMDEEALGKFQINGKPKTL